MVATASPYVAPDDSAHPPGNVPTEHRTEPRYLPAAARRFDVRLSEDTLTAWRELARRDGITVAELVRAAVDLVDSLPPGTVRAGLARAEAARAEAARAEAARAAMAASFHAAADVRPVDSPAAGAELGGR